MEKITVVMTTYNGEKYIREQLESIFMQTRLPDELIIADDCSSDSTNSIVEEMKCNTKISIINYINTDNLGYIKNFRNAMQRATGDYIFLCDQDDIWKSNKIETTIRLMKVHRANVACTGFQLIDGDGKYIANTDVYRSDPISGYSGWTNHVMNIPFNRLIWGNFSPGCTYCFTRKILTFFEKINNTELSHDFQILLIGANFNSAIFIDTPLSFYRLHQYNTIGMNNKEKKRERHLQPRISRFMKQLSAYCSVKNYYINNIILYLRLPKIRSVILHYFNLSNKLNLRYKID